MSEFKNFVSATEANEAFKIIQKAEEDEAIKRCCEDIFRKISEDLGKGELIYPYGQGAPKVYDDAAAAIDKCSIESVIAVLRQARYSVEDITPEVINDRYGVEQPRSYLHISWKNLSKEESKE